MAARSGLARVVSQPRAFSFALVALVTIYAARLSGSEGFTTLYTPDSEFYFSLAVFGDDVTARAPYDAYYWTRLGLLAPLRFLTLLFGTWAGAAAYRSALVLVVASSSFVLLRRLGASLTLSSVAMTILTLNTVVLAFLGDPYVTGTALAALALLWALISVALTSDGRSALCAAVGVGAVCGWLVMINPYATLLGVATAAALAGVIAVARRPAIRRLAGLVALASVGGACSFGGFVLLGRRMFPGLAWLDTTVYFIRVLKFSDYASPDLRWARTETSLLVPLGCLVLSAAALALRPSSLLARAGALLVTVNLGFALGYVVIVPGPTIEASFYSAMLWPGCLLGVVLCVSALEGPPPALAGRQSVLGPVAATAVALTVAGHWSRPLPTWAALSLSVVGAGGAAALAVLAARRIRTPSVTAVGALVVLFATGQVLQNGRPSQGGFALRLPYASAFRESGARRVLVTDVAVERFLLRETSKGDTVLLWVQPESMLRSPAAMQLGGPNTAAQGATFSTAEAANLQAVSPSAVVSYFYDPQAMDAMLASIPPEAHPEQDRCEQFRIDDGHSAFTVCVTRLTWNPTAP